MRNEGKSWAAIKVAWQKITKEDVGKSTLPNRHSRLLDNFAVVKEDDLGFLMQAKLVVDKDWETRKWKEV